MGQRRHCRTSRRSRPTWSAQDDGHALIAGRRPATTICADAAPTSVTANDDIMAGFSSQGPTDVDFRVKPDVVAPGVNVL